MKKNKNLMSLNEHLNKEHGVIGTSKRDEFERKYQEFKLGIFFREARKKAKLTQQDLAERVNTKKSYISRLENNYTDIRLSTLKRLIEEGLEGELSLTIKIPGHKAIKI